MNRDQVMEHLRPLTQLKTKVMEHTPKTRIIMQPDMMILRPGSGGRMMPIAPQGITSLAKFSGFPKDLANQITPDTFGRVATELLSRQERYNVVTKDGQVTAFAKAGEYHSMAPERVLHTIERVVGETEYQRVMVMEQYARLEVVGTEERPVVRGDMVRAGAVVQFSPIGTMSPSVQAYVMRLVCTNGATSNTVLREFSFTGGNGNGSDSVWEWIRTSVREAYRAVGPITQRWGELAAEQLAPEDRALVLARLINDARLPKEAADAVRARALTEPPENSYAAMNLITWASSHVLQQPRDIIRAQNTAATFTDEDSHRRQCPVCRTLR